MDIAYLLGYFDFSLLIAVHWVPCLSSLDLLHVFRRHQKIVEPQNSALTREEGTQFKTQALTEPPKLRKSYFSRVYAQTFKQFITTDYK